MKKLNVNANTRSNKKPSYHHGDLLTALIDSAEIELSEKGVEAFSLRRVAKRIGVSHAAPAYHFGDTKGLLTALAAEGFKRLLEGQEKRQHKATNDARSQLAALGLGYIGFAIENPSLFRLMFSSEKPDVSNEALTTASGLAFQRLLTNVGNLTESNPSDDKAAMTDVMATWAMVHGLADLLIGANSSFTIFFENMNQTDQQKFLSDIILRPFK